MQNKISIRKISENEVRCMRKASLHAKANSGCTKANVGSYLATLLHGGVLGANRTLGSYDCIHSGCHRTLLYGNNSKEHRLPADCMSIHSEQDAIAKAAKEGRNTDGATIFVTRYPCETCAKMIIQAGIKRVYYGGVQSASDMTLKMFKANNIEVIWIYDYNETLDTVEDICCNTCKYFSLENGVCDSWRLKVANAQNHKCDFWTRRA